MARLNIKWETRSTVAVQAASTADSDAKAGEETDKNVGSSKLERPLLVYVTSDDNTDSTSRKLEDVCFADERIAIGSKLFTCVKITAGNAAQDRLLSANGEETPRLVLISRDYEVQDVLESRKLSSGKIVRAMSKAARADYKTSFDSLVSSYQKLLNELDRLDGKRTLIADKIERAGDSKAKLKKAEREKEQFEKEMEEWKQKEQKLLDFKLRDPIKSKA